MVKRRRLLGACAIAALLILAVLALKGHNFVVLNPAGPVATKERNLFIFAVILSLLVVIPVFAMTIYIVWKYRAGRQSKYSPDWDHSRIAETIWWLVPTALITVLAVVTWNSSHELDPFKPLASDNPAINVQVVALDWKWLFIYPDLHVASVNMLEFPMNTPVNMQITSDAPMNSLWIPQLSGQVYAMSGMSTQLHIMASKQGDYRGVSANISGAGFASMHFIARATTQEQFNNWLAQTQQNTNPLTDTAYASLAKPSLNSQPTYFSAVYPNLYYAVINKYNQPSPYATGSMSSMSGMGVTQ